MRARTSSEIANVACNIFSLCCFWCDRLTRTEREVVFQSPSIRFYCVLCSPQVSLHLYPFLSMDTGRYQCLLFFKSVFHVFIPLSYIQRISIFHITVTWELPN